MRRICLLLAAIVLAGWPAAWPSAASAEEPPHAYHRLDRVGAALAKDPLFVDLTSPRRSAGPTAHGSTRPSAGPRSCSARRCTSW